MMGQGLWWIQTPFMARNDTAKQPRCVLCASVSEEA